MKRTVMALFIRSGDVSCYGPRRSCADTRFIPTTFG
jgi:hypothetical protein